MSVFYCVGNIGVKRKEFRTPRENSVFADNEDVLSYFSLSGKLYCLLGKLPFSDMLVRDYIAYQRALTRSKPLTDKEIGYVLRAVGCRLPLYKKISSLSRVQFRHLQLAAKWSVEVKTLYVNLDGVHYCRKTRRQVKKLTAALQDGYEVYLALSDSRFLPCGAHVIEYSQDGAVKQLKPKPQISKLTPKRCLGRYFKEKENPGLDYKSVESVVLITR